MPRSLPSPLLRQINTRAKLAQQICCVVRMRPGASPPVYREDNDAQNDGDRDHRVTQSITPEASSGTVARRCGRRRVFFRLIHCSGRVRCPDASVSLCVLGSVVTLAGRANLSSSPGPFLRIAQP
jgi:hypothetical protein